MFGRLQQLSSSIAGRCGVCHLAKYSRRSRERAGHRREPGQLRWLLLRRGEKGWRIKTDKLTR